MSVPLETIRRILRLATTAPSGDNSQPWRFSVSGSSITIYALPELDHPILNYKGRGTLVAHGALIENVCIAASAEGLSTTVTLLPDRDDRSTARIVLMPQAGVLADPLVASLEKRHTNRKAYETTALPEVLLQKCIVEAKKCNVTLCFASKSESRKKIAEAGSCMEEIALETKDLHRLFFNDILWTEKEGEDGKSGLTLRSLELPPPGRVVLRAMRLWVITSLLSKIGFTKLIAKGNAAVYAKCGNFIGFKVRDHEPRSYIEAGRALSRVWLLLTSENYSAQPMTGTLYLGELLLAGKGDLFSDAQKSRIMNSYKEIQNELGADDSVLPMLIRAGKSSPPSAYTHRKEPDIAVA